MKRRDWLLVIGIVLLALFVFWLDAMSQDAKAEEEYHAADAGLEGIKLPDYGMQQVERGSLCNGEKYRCESLVGGVLVCMDLGAWDQIHRARQVGARGQIAADLTRQAIEQGRCFVSEPQIVEVHPNPYAHVAPDAAFVVFPEDRALPSTTGLVAGYFVEREAVTHLVEVEQ